MIKIIYRCDGCGNEKGELLFQEGLGRVKCAQCELHQILPKHTYLENSNETLESVK